MVTRDQARRARGRLDARLATLGVPDSFIPPRLGWVRAVREALGMSLAELGRRMNVSAQSLQNLERNEVRGVARLDSLRRAAEAMDCTLVYALIPNVGLEQTLQQRAELVVWRESNAAEHSMVLEAQDAELPPAAREAQVQRLLDSGRVWSPG